MCVDHDAITFYGTTWCPDCIRARRYLEGRGIDYRWVDISRDPEAAAYVERVNHGYRSVPTIVFADGAILVEPSTAELSRHLQQAGYQVA